MTSLRKENRNVSELHVASQFLDGEELVGRVPEGDYLPEEDAEGPDVGLGGVDAVEYRLRGHPLDRQPPAGFLPVVLRRLDVSATEILSQRSELESEIKALDYKFKAEHLTWLTQSPQSCRSCSR